jgi:hypothetical protein
MVERRLELVASESLLKTAVKFVRALSNRWKLVTWRNAGKNVKKEWSSMTALEIILHWLQEKSSVCHYWVREWNR